MGSKEGEPSVPAPRIAVDTREWIVVALWLSSTKKRLPKKVSLTRA